MIATKQITSVKELVEALDNSEEFGGYLNIMRTINIPREEFERYYSWNDENYTRNCLARNKDYELLLICYEEGQESPIHDFNSHEAWIHPIQGEITEERFKEKKRGKGLEKVSSVRLGPSEFSFMSGNIGIHRYLNTNEGRSVSLNLYAKPVTKWNLYDEEAGFIDIVKVESDQDHKITG